jgi:hypothetical protein
MVSVSTSGWRTLGITAKGRETPILRIALSAMIHNHIGGREVGEGTGRHEGANDVSPKQTHIYLMSPTVPPEAPADPVAAKERDDALEQSARRAAGLVVEARAERQAQHDRAVQDLIAQLLAHGLPEYFQIGAGDFSEENDRIRARTGVFPPHCAVSSY